MVDSELRELRRCRGKHASEAPAPVEGSSGRPGEMRRKPSRIYDAITR